MKGFYVPASRSSDYVAQKRDTEGSFAYDKAAIELGIQKQQALQGLQKSYESTIENAYASYLAGQQNIGASQMGQGFKEAYRQQQEQNLLSNIAQANQSTTSARAQIEQSESQARSALDTQFKTEVSNLDRVANMMNDYREYLASLYNPNDASQKFFLENEENLKTEELYQMLYGAQPVGLVDPEGQAGKSFARWTYYNVGTTEADQEWLQWLVTGGYQDFYNAALKTGGQYSRAAYQAAEEKKRQEKIHQEELNEAIENSKKSEAERKRDEYIKGKLRPGDVSV